MEIVLRPWKTSDIDDLARHANNYNIARNLMDRFPHPYTKTDALGFIQMANEHTPPMMLAITHNDEPIGGIGIHPLQDIYRRNAEMGYWLAEHMWGKGIITIAIGRMVDYAFTHFNINRIFAKPFPYNTGSIRALEKNGFVLEARFYKTVLKEDQEFDELVYAIRKESQ
jgi:RimJ/RimL family protein N-acetyltransferase